MGRRDVAVGALWKGRERIWESVARTFLLSIVAEIFVDQASNVSLWIILLVNFIFVRVRVPLLIFSWHFQTPETLNLHAVYGGFHLQVTLNALKYALFIHTVRLPRLPKICPSYCLRRLSFLSGTWKISQ